MDSTNESYAKVCIHLWSGNIPSLCSVFREQPSHPVTVRNAQYLAVWTHAQNQNPVELVLVRDWWIDMELKIVYK